jgi:hypothetical protein
VTWKDQRERFIAAMVRAEGGEAAFVRAVRCSIPTCADFAEAHEIAITTLNHALWDYAMNHDLAPRGFVDFLASRWAPVGVANDPTNLNANWPGNVWHEYLRLEA